MFYLFESKSFLLFVAAMRLEIIYLNFFYQTIATTRLLKVRSTLIIIF